MRGGGDQTGPRRGGRTRNGCPDFLELARQENGELEDLPSAWIEAHARTCHTCRAQLDDLRQAREELLEPWRGARARAAAAQIAERISYSRRRFWRFATVASAAAALALFAFRPVTKPEQVISTVRSKGSFSIAMYCRRGMDVFVPDERTVFERGDRLRFAYTSGENGYLAIFGVEPNGRLFPYYPESSLSPLPVAPGRHVVLPDSIELDAHAGDEKIVAIWSPTPWQEPELRRAVVSALSAGRGDVRSLDRLVDIASAKQVVFTLPRR